MSAAALLGSESCNRLLRLLFSCNIVWTEALFPHGALSGSTYLSTSRIPAGAHPPCQMYFLQMIVCGSDVRSGFWVTGVEEISLWVLGASLVDGFYRHKKKHHISSLWGRKTAPVNLRRPNYSWTLTPKINWNSKVCMTSCWMLGMRRMTQHSLWGFGIEGDIHQSAGAVCCWSMVAVTVGWLCTQSKLLLMEAEEETDLLRASHRFDSSRNGREGNCARDWDNSRVMFHLHQARLCW